MGCRYFRDFTIVFGFCLFVTLRSYVTALYLEKFSLHFSSSSFAIRVLKSSPSLTILVPFWFIIASLVFVFPGKLLFNGFLQINDNFQRSKKTTQNIVT